jgi:hypothetical protein
MNLGKRQKTPAKPTPHSTSSESITPSSEVTPTPSDSRKRMKMSKAEAEAEEMKDLYKEQSSLKTKQAEINLLKARAKLISAGGLDAETANLKAMQDKTLHQYRMRELEVKEKELVARELEAKVQLRRLATGQPPLHDEPIKPFALANNPLSFPLAGRGNPPNLSAGSEDGVLPYEILKTFIHEGKPYIMTDREWAMVNNDEYWVEPYCVLEQGNPNASLHPDWRQGLPLPRPCNHTELDATDEDTRGYVTEDQLALAEARARQAADEYESLKKEREEKRKRGEKEAEASTA